MAEKDLAEKILESYNDVFADIINGLIFKGEQVIEPKMLIDSNVHSQYKANDGTLHEQERDVFKTWIKNDITFAICGIENQSQPEKLMPFRVIGYDGAAYRDQIRYEKGEDDILRKTERRDRGECICKTTISDLYRWKCYEYF